MKYILLKGLGDKSAIVDDEDYQHLTQWTWRTAGRNYEYAYRYTHTGSSKNGTRKQISIPMHREIMKPPKDKQIDHINGNKLDNRKENLRLATNSQNHQNIGITAKNTSGYKGVRQVYKNTKWRNPKWRAECNGKYIGDFSTREEAARAYNEAAKQHHGEFARLNNA